MQLVRDSEQPDSQPLHGRITPDKLVAELGLKTVLAFGAHPDDVDFGASATLAALNERGVHVTLSLLTTGDAGGFDPTRTADETAHIREREQQDAAAVLGVNEVVQFHEPDGFVEPHYELVGKIVKVMRQVRPQAVFSLHPERAWDRMQKSHPDHLATGEAVVRACYPAVENPFSYPELAAEGLEAYKIPHLLMMCAPRHLAQTKVDVTGYQDLKIAALSQHFTQHRDAERMEEFVTAQMRNIHGVGGYAEEFHHVVVNAPETISGF